MTQVNQSAAGRPLVGVGMVMCAVLAFALSDILTKHLALLYPLPIVVAVRYFFNVLLLVLIMGPRLKSALWQTNRTWLVLVRALVLAFASLTMGLALQIMPVGETVGILYLSPFLVMILAVPLLKEKVTRFGWIAALVGFSGVLLIIRPGNDLPAMGVALALANAGCATAYLLLSRYLASTETTWSMLFYACMTGLIFFGILAIEHINTPLPTLFDFSLMVALGAFSLLGHFLFTAAYREAPASLLAPINYMHLVWAGLLGFVFFAEVPSWLSILGMVLVAASGVALALHSHFTKQKSKH